MTKYLLTSAAALALSTGSVLAAGPYVTTVAPVTSVPGYESGYLFPNDGSPSGDEPWAHVETQPQGPGLYSRIYLYPPSEGSDGGNG